VSMALLVPSLPLSCTGQRSLVVIALVASPWCARPSSSHSLRLSFHFYSSQRIQTSRIHHCPDVLLHFLSLSPSLPPTFSALETPFTTFPSLPYLYGTTCLPDYHTCLLSRCVLRDNQPLSLDLPSFLIDFDGTFSRKAPSLGRSLSLLLPLGCLSSLSLEPTLQAHSGRRNVVPERCLVV